MPKGNLIKVSFGKPRAPISESQPLAVRHQPVNLAEFKKARNGGFLTKLRVYMVMTAKNALAVNFTVKPEDWKWFLAHEKTVREFMNRVRLIHVIDPETKEAVPFVVQEDVQVMLAYPKGEVRKCKCLRVYFFLSIASQLREEVVQNREVTLFVSKSE